MPRVKEESITDRFIYSMRTACRRFRFVDYNRRQESRIGADYDWIIQFDTFYWALRVQAKCLSPTRSPRDGLLYPNGRGEQIDKLFRSTRDTAFLPVYAFYSAPSGSLPRNATADDSIFLCLAINARLLIDNEEPISDSLLLNCSVPLVHLLCSQLGLINARKLWPEDSLPLAFDLPNVFPASSRTKGFREGIHPAINLFSQDEGFKDDRHTDDSRGNQAVKRLVVLDARQIE